MTKTNPRIIICDDDESIHQILRPMLEPRYRAQSVLSGSDLLTQLSKHQFDCLLLDLNLVKPNDGLALIPKIREIDADLPIVIVSATTEFKTVQDALRRGVADYISKESGLKAEEVLHVLDRTLEREHLIQSNEQKSHELSRYQQNHQLVGKSPAIQQLLRMIEKIRKSGGNVLIFGETGTGKEIVARQLRMEDSDGALCPFVPVDSSTIQSSVAESVLFGHEKGSFTGAERVKKGLFEEAHGGIIYFDEIANMPLEIQAKLLRVIQEKEITRLGSTRLIHLDFRVICATNRDLEGMAKKGEFKEDLYQRLNVLPLQLPPLREHPEDIPDLIRHFVARQTGNPETIHFTAAALAMMSAYGWPGNIRELSNVIVYALTMSERGEVDVDDLPPKLTQGAQPGLRTTQPANASPSIYERISEFERQLLLKEFENCGQNIRLLAENLKMDRTHLYRKLRDFGIYQPANKNTPP